MNSFSRRRFLQSAAGAAAVPALAQTRRPNIVLIMADDLGYECLGCNGAAEYRTPKLDALAASGVRFTHAHSTPLCTPTRVQLMTGKYNFRNYTNFGSLPKREFTFGHLLQRAGYKTGVVGKWQLAGAIPGTAYQGEGTLPQDAGFDEHCLWQVKDRGSRYWDPTVQINGKLQDVRTGGYGPDVFTGYAEEFIERHRGEPFFLYYAMALTHDPFVPTPHSKEHGAGQKQRSDAAWFGDMVAYMDHLVGRIVSKIDSLGLGRDTIVIFTADNGTHPSITTQTRNGPYRGGKGGTTEAGTHVPLIARWRNREGRVCDDLIDFTDFFPTFAQAAGASIPDAHPRDGRSFLAQLNGQKGNARPWLFCHYEPKWGKFQKARWVMNKRWKLYGDGRLYDLQSDPLERQAIAGAPPEAKRVLAEFRDVLSRMQPARET